MDQIFHEIPAQGKRIKTNLARTLLEDREGSFIVDNQLALELSE
jgi:hypothetical protein